MGVRFAPSEVTGNGRLWTWGCPSCPTIQYAGVIIANDGEKAGVDWNCWTLGRAAGGRCDVGAEPPPLRITWGTSRHPFPGDPESPSGSRWRNSPDSAMCGTPSIIQAASYAR